MINIAASVSRNSLVILEQNLMLSRWNLFFLNLFSESISAKAVTLVQ